ncbi:FadR/GntR family transcriptional regulator [Roseospira goensis]|uniref:DNA-binding FadR family transcriptional regulator n=1 Tax=Roseospira goensis TaxID=391922 RepID=A0A7W6S1T1_9PROT|nr:FCD domain-containing protein [Roseospira goensis]MBB4287156.1 DNA-binding FadR family transcriptional regulator [Roseospira goensis]
MALDYQPLNRDGLARQIADSLRTAILTGDLSVDERLPTETDLAARYGVSRPTIREALKRLAAQNLIRSRRGPAGGTFVNRIGLTEARDSLRMMVTLMVGMDAVTLADVAEARDVLERVCARLAATRRGPADLEALRAALAEQRDPALSDEDFCAADVRFHRAVVEATGNAMLGVQMVGVVEALQPVLNMIIHRVRARPRIVAHHAAILAAIEAGDADAAEAAMGALMAYVGERAGEAQMRRRPGREPDR